MSGNKEISPGIGTCVREAAGAEPFAAALDRRGLSLVRGEITTLQVNTGYLCNLRCRHCHLEAGPGRAEIMSRETMAAVVSFARRFRFRAIDLTGGAPELVPDLPFLVEGLAPLAPRLMLRTNLRDRGLLLRLHRGLRLHLRRCDIGPVGVDGRGAPAVTPRSGSHGRSEA